MPEIIQFCVIQENLNGIIIEYIPSNTFKPDVLTTIKTKISIMLQEPDINIDFKAVSYIPPTPLGKPQIIISKIMPTA